MIIAKWKFEGLFKGDAQKVAEEIYSIGEEATPQQILDKARDKKTELNKCFEWDDSKAAEKWRLQTARQIACSLVIKVEENKPQPPTPIRVFYTTPKAEGYKPTEYIVRDKNAYSELLAQAKAELRNFKAKYKSLTELEDIFALIDEI